MCVCRVVTSAKCDCVSTGVTKSATFFSIDSITTRGKERKRKVKEKEKRGRRGKEKGRRVEQWSDNEMRVSSLRGEQERGEYDVSVSHDERMLFLSPSLFSLPFLHLSSVGPSPLPSSLHAHIAHLSDFLNTLLPCRSVSRGMDERTNASNRTKE